MNKSKILVALVLLMSKTSFANSAEKTELSVDRKVVETYLSEQDLSMLLENGVLLPQQDGTLKLNPVWGEAVHDINFNNGRAAPSAICVKD